MGKKIVSVTYENERISIKNSLPALLKMCVTSLLCGPWVDLLPFYGFLAGLPRARSARGTEPHTHGIWSTSFHLVVT